MVRLEVAFTELYDRESNEIGITRDESQDVLQNPDKIQEEIIDDLIIRFFLKKESHRNSFLIIQTRVMNDKLYLDLPFRIYPDLFPNIEILEPLMILQLLAQEYGLFIKIGSQLGKFIYKEEIPITKNREKIMQIRNPENHSFLRNIFIKTLKTDNDKVIVKCAIAFCIDKTHYKNWFFLRKKLCLQ